MRLADTIEEATHRYPTSIHWPGVGRFASDNFMFQYVVAASDRDALVLGQIRGAYLLMCNVQRKRSTGDGWEFCE